MEQQTDTAAWHPATKYGAQIITAATIGYVLWAQSARPYADLGALIGLTVVAGIALTLVGGTKTIGAFRTGMYATATGAALTALGLLVFAPMAADTSSSGNISIASGDLWTLLSELVSGPGVILIITGVIMTIVGFIRRKLRPDDNKASPSN